MSVQGPSSLPFRPFTPAGANAAGAAPASRARAEAKAAAAPASTSASAPAESSLWELLTADERDFFSQQASLGALTYGRARGAAAKSASAAGSGPIGQRLDVRG